jgi:GT2 family glycosyltransferase
MKASIVIPTCGRESRLRDLLGSLKQQTAERSEFEVVLVDNSPGGLEGSVIRAFAEDLQFEFLREPRVGAAFARNLGSEKAKSDIVIFLDDDMTVEPDFVREHLRVHETEERRVGVLGRIVQAPLRPRKFISSYLAQSVHQNLSLGDDEREAGYDCFYSANISVPRTALQECGGFDQSFPYYGWEDIDLGYRLVKAGIPILYNPKAVGYHHFDTTTFRYLGRRFRSGKSLRFFLSKHPELRKDFHISNVSLLSLVSKTIVAIIALLPAILVFRVREKPLFRVFDAIGSFVLFLGFRQARHDFGASARSSVDWNRSGK